VLRAFTLLSSGLQLPARHLGHLDILASLPGKSRAIAVCGNRSAMLEHTADALELSATSTTLYRCECNCLGF